MPFLQIDTDAYRRKQNQEELKYSKGTLLRGKWRSNLGFIFSSSLSIIYVRQVKSLGDAVPVNFTVKYKR